MNAVRCPECIEGVTYKTCTECRGSGLVDLEQVDILICETCDGAGEIESRHCAICSGSGVVTTEYIRLYESDAYVRRQDPQWDGNSFDRPGVTVYSLAQWFRNRDRLRNEVVAVRCWPWHSSWASVNTVCVWTKDEQLTLHGLAWGYSGEGPSGLVTILDDCGFKCPKPHADTRSYVASLDVDASYLLLCFPKSVSESVTAEMMP